MGGVLEIDPGRGVAAVRMTLSGAAVKVRA